MFQREEQDKSVEIDSNKTKIYILPEREFKMSIIEMFTEARRIMHRETENFNKQKILKVPNKSWGIKNKITEQKNK